MLNDIKKDATTRMTKSVDALRHELSQLRTGRASTALVDHIQVNYYGSEMPLSQVATRGGVRRAHADDHALGKADGRRGREGHPGLEPRPDAEHRRHRPSASTCRR